MPTQFTNARVDSFGSVRGTDEAGHDVFKLVRSDGPTLYGEYFYNYPDPKVWNFDVEIGPFGYLDPRAMGDIDPAYREHFSPDEASAPEQLIRTYSLSNPPIYAKRNGPEARFLGGIRFRQNWIIPK
jgi:hypothetical protein